MSIMDKSENALAAANVNKPRLSIKHADLERSGESDYHRICPVCNQGILSVRRHHDTFMLLSVDRCLLCGQEVEYTDIPNGKLSALPPQAS